MRFGCKTVPKQSPSRAVILYMLRKKNKSIALREGESVVRAYFQLNQVLITLLMLLFGDKNKKKNCLY